jgi:leader peptidase (prepilin peptidase)/N-methyltransferase
MLRLLGIAFAALTGLAFGSFLNVCLTRWPNGESIVAPRSHCRSCGHTLAWWENIPLASWIVLRGRCRTCNVPIGWRYPLVELAVGALWAVAAWNSAFNPETDNFSSVVLRAIGYMILYWLLIALALLDIEHLWLPDWLTLPGIALGIVYTLAFAYLNAQYSTSTHVAVLHAALSNALSILFAAGMILLIRGIYWLIRRQEGMGLGDAKLMAMLAAWLGFSRSVVAFFFGVVLGAVVALVLLAQPRQRQTGKPWRAVRLPLGTFLCIGGIAASLWGKQITVAYLHWLGFY